MKLNHLLTGALSLALFAACSNDDGPITTGGQEEQTPDGYIAVNLQLPTTAASRAANDKFEDGEASEYAVEEGILLLFKTPDATTAEGSATFCGAYDLGFPRYPETGDGISQGGNVTLQYRRAVKVSGLTLGDNEQLYGLVMLNNTVPNILLSTGNTISIDGEDFGLSSTFDQLLAKTSKVPFAKSEKGEIASKIFMCNSPLANTGNTIGGGQNPIPESTVIKTLVNLTKSLQPTEAEAIANPAGTIYVERAVAKVTMSMVLKNTSIPESGISTGIKVNNDYTLYVKNVEWAMGNREESSYLVRRISDGTNTINWNLASTKPDVAVAKYRMIGSAGVKENVSDPENNNLLFRPYWCIDPAYSDDKTEPHALDDMIAWNGNQAFYPFENTFNVANQIYKNTTRVGMWITMALCDKDGKVDGTKTFYTRNADKGTVYFDNEKGQNPLVYNVYADLSNNDAVKDAWKEALKDQEGSGSAEFNVEDLIDIEFEIQSSGLLLLTGVSFKENNDLYTSTPSYDFTNLISNFKLAYQFYEYKDGKVFYEYRIKHFGDDLTPWAFGDRASSVEESYGEDGTERDNNYLGRYGMVRNNWYDVNVTSLSKLGDPRDPAEWDTSWDNTPDDNKEQYIALDIAVLSWAKRLQNVDF